MTQAAFLTADDARLLAETRPYAVLSQGVQNLIRETASQGMQATRITDRDCLGILSAYAPTAIEAITEYDNGRDTVSARIVARLVKMLTSAGYAVNTTRTGSAAPFLSISW